MCDHEGEFMATNGVPRATYRYINNKCDDDKSIIYSIASHPPA